MRAVGETLRGAVITVCAADARARHRAGRAHHDCLGGLARRGPTRRPPRARTDRPASRRRASAIRTAVRSRRNTPWNRSSAARPAIDAPRADLAHDRRRAFCVAGAGHQPPRSDPRSREGPMARRHTRVQPLQIQLVSCERRFAVVAADDRPAGPYPSPRQSRPPERTAAGARVPIAGWTPRSALPQSYTTFSISS